MESVREYLIGVTAAAIFCGVLTRLIGNKGVTGALLKLVVGVFMVLAVVSPWLQVRWEQLMDITTDIKGDAEAAAAEGVISAREAMEEIITEQTAAYILDKADSLGVRLTVEVDLDSGEIPVPCAVRLAGNISPYAKSVLSEYISENLGIGTEEQTWIQS